MPNEWHTTQTSGADNLKTRALVEATVPLPLVVWFLGAHIESVDRLGTEVNDATRVVEVHVITHGFSNNLDEDRQALASRESGTPHVFVNPNGNLKQIAALRVRAVKRLDSREQ